MKRIALFASGTGTNVLNLLDHVNHFSKLTIPCVVVDSETSPLPVILMQKYPHVCVELILPENSLKGAARKLEHESRILACLEQHQINWVLLAGYMRLIGSTLLDRYSNRIINIHPSLLPHYPGLDGYARAFTDGVATSGVTVHLVDAGMDTGPILIQRSFKRLPGDTLETFVQRGKVVEWELYPEVLSLLNDSAELLPGA